MPPEKISEIRRRVLGLDKVAINDGNIVKKKSIRAFPTKLRANFQGVKIRQEQNCLMLLQIMSTILDLMAFWS